jgi:hypothetical protein
VANVDEVETILDGLLERFREMDPATRAMMPAHRTIEARCPDLDLVRYGRWNNGTLYVSDEPISRRPDIRISVRSDDLVRLSRGELTFGQAYLGGRIRIDASMSDLLRLRAVL